MLLLNFNSNSDINEKFDKDNDDSEPSIYTSSNHPPNADDFNYYKEITIDHTKVSGTGSHANFPLLISIIDSDLRDQVQSDGDDIAFSNGSAWLDHEIEYFSQTYNPSFAKLIAWVRIPSLSTSVDTVIRMYYGNSTMTSRQNPTGVWNSNYIMVQHLEENSGIHYDSTNNSNDGTPHNGTTQDIMGKINGADSFDGIDDCIKIPLSSSLNLTGAFSIEMWVKFYNDPPTHNAIFSQGATLTSPSYYPMSGPSIVLTNTQKLYFDIYNDTDRDSAIIDTINWNFNEWYHWVFIFNGTDNDNQHIYVNGIEAPITHGGTANISNPHALNLDFFLGVDNGGGAGWPQPPRFYFNGTIDEVRISNINHPAAWIETVFNNQYDHNSFYSIGSANKLYIPSFEDFEYYKEITIDHTKVNGLGTHDNFPVLISIFDRDLHDDVQADGDDIAFSNGSAWLDHEIELFNRNYNDTHAQLIAWIRVPSLNTAKDTNIYMYYGNSTICSQENPTGVWDTTYMGVWHLFESSGAAKDSTFYDEYGIVSGTTTQGSNGQINSAYDFGTDGTIIIDDSADEHLDFNGTESFSISFWINIDASTGKLQLPLYKGGASIQDEGYNFETSIDGQSLKFYICDGNKGGNDRVGSSAANIIFDQWIYITGVVNRSSNLIHMYKDGSEVGSGTPIGSVGDLNNTCDLQFPWASYDGLNGLLDEVRISDVPRSADWIVTEYNNQYNPNSFYAIGMEYRSGFANIQVNAIDLYDYPISNVNVSIHNETGVIQSAITNNNGYVVFSNIPQSFNDGYNFTVSMTSNIDPLRTETINRTSEAIIIDKPFHNIILICNNSRNIFSVEDVDGLPLSSGWIVVSKNSVDLQNCTLDSTGTTIFRWLNTTGYSYKVWYKDVFYDPNAILLESGSIASPNSTIDLTVNLTTADFTIWTDDHNQVVSGVKLMFYNTSSGTSIVNFTTDLNGEATFRWLTTNNNFNYSLNVTFYGDKKRIRFANDIDPFHLWTLELNITTATFYEIEMDMSSSQLEEYKTAIVSLNPTDNIQIEQGSKLKLRALFNVTKVPTGSPIPLGPTYADSMSYEIYDEQSTLVLSGTISIEIHYNGRHQCEIETEGLESKILYSIIISAYKSEYVIPYDLQLSLYLFENTLILNQSENDDSVQTKYWLESVNMSVKPYGKISEDFVLEDTIFHAAGHTLKFLVPDISNDWNLSQISFNIYNISWNVDEPDINITIEDPYGDITKYTTDNHSGYDFSGHKWIGITLDIDMTSPTEDNSFNFTIGGSFDDTIDIIAEVHFIRDKVNVQYRKFNVTDSINILSIQGLNTIYGNGWVIKNITFDIYNCRDPSSWNLIDPISAIEKLATNEGINYTFVSSDLGTGKIIIDNIKIYPFANQFLFTIYNTANFVFNVNITVVYIQEFYKNQYLESIFLPKTVHNFKRLVDTFQVSAIEEGWTDEDVALLFNGINNGTNYFSPSDLAMNITINGQLFSISDTPKGDGIFYLENVPGFNKDIIYSAIIETNQPVNFTLSFKIKYSRMVYYETKGTVTYVIIEAPNVYGTVEYDENLGYYQQIIDTSLIDADDYTIRFIVTKDHYNSDSKDLDLEVLERLTLISGSSSNLDLYPIIYVQDASNYTFSYTDAVFSTTIQNLDVQSYTVTKIGAGGQSVLYGSGDLYINSDIEYVLDINTETLQVGRYSIWITLEKQNYQSKQAIIFLTVNEREIEYDLGDMFEDKQTSVVKGEKITLSIELTDPTKGDIPLTGAKVILEIGDDELEFEEVEAGVYEVEFDTKEYEAFFTSNTITGTIKISKANYTSEDTDITIVIEMEEIEVIPGILSIPTFYLMIAIAAIVAVLGSLATYRYVQLARIPKFVKKIRAMKAAIKKSKVITETISLTSKDVYMVSMVSDKWETLGFSMDKIFGIPLKKGKTLPIMEKEIAASARSPDLMPSGLILMRWNERIGTEIVMKYPEEISLSKKTLMQLYGTHEYTGEPGMISLIVGNLNIASYYTGPEKSYYLVLILNLDDDADAYEGGMVDVLHVILQSLENDAYLQLIPSLFRRLAVYPTLNHEQQLANTYQNIIKRMIITRLRDEGVIDKSELMVWLKDKYKEGLFNLEVVLLDLIKREIIKQVSVKGMPSELNFLASDLLMLRTPPVELVKNPGRNGLPAQFAKDYLNDVKKFFEEYRPTLEDNIKMIDMLTNAQVYQVLQLLRTAIVTKDDLEKLKKKGVDDVSFVLKSLWQNNMICVYQGKDGKEYYALLSDFYIRLVFPKYILEAIKQAYEQRSKHDKVLIEYLTVLEESYLNLKSEGKLKG